MKIPRLLIAGTHSGVGKTTVTVGLLRLLRRAGRTVQPFKVGPDYIDPGYLSRAAGRPCRNLDGWLVPKGKIPVLFQRGCRGADAALIEGVMGLYDGIGPIGEEGSSAQMAKLLDCPVLLVIDAGAMSRSAAALVRGYAGFDRRVKITGCFVNRVAGRAHFELVKEGIERLTGFPVIGYLPRDGRLSIPERHLGLIPTQEDSSLGRIGERLDRRMREGLDLPALRRIMEAAGPILSLRAPKGPSSDGSRVPIAVAMDEAFHFYYRENLELLEEFGSEIVPFSPLRASRLPKRARALYLGGGFPEVFAAELARNRRMHQEIRCAVASGMPTYAECGGLMILCRSIADTGGKRHPMVGLIPADVRMTDRLQNFGYQEVKARGANLLARAGEKARGHEFHHSILNGPPAAQQAAYQVRTRQGGETRLEGYAKGSLLASYVHLHFWSQPRWAQQFVERARTWRS